ncbi:MAG: glycosyltransferase family 4 protein [bacterium JZ-2024 1]
MNWLSSGLAFFITITTTSFIIPLSVRKNLLDYPDERKIHHSPTPRLGGIPLLTGFFLASLLLFSTPEKFAFFFSFFLPPLFIFFVGLMDDISSLSVKEKLFGQILAVLLFAVLPVSLPRTPSWFFFAGMLFLLFLPNALNFLDGWDGLLLCQTSWAIFWLLLSSSSLPHEWLYPLLGSTLGLLVFNFPPGKIFAGDSTAYFIGLLLAQDIFLHCPSHPRMALGTFLLLSLPIADTLFSLFRRLWQGKSPFSPDLAHLHHRVYFWLSSKKALHKNFTLYGLLFWNIYFFLCFLLALGISAAFPPKS